MKTANLAHLKPESPFYALFPNGMAPIKNILLPRTGIMEGDNQDRPQEFYDLAVDQCTREQLWSVARVASQKLGGTPEEVMAQIKTRGMPIRVSQCSSVSTNVPWFL